MTLKILIVDADPAKREALRFSLETEGYAVAEAADGRNALMAMASELPALVLQDRVLLDMTGAELTGQLHALPGGSAIPTLYTSGL